MKKIFIAATKQNDGKTTVSLGLIFNFQKKFKKVSFIKPIGQRYLEEEGLKIDEDSWLIEEVCGIKVGLKNMSPIAVEKGFTEKYISRPDKKSITTQIKSAFGKASKKQDLVIIEGTGHAGVGSVFDHSNARVAKLLGSKVVIISSGGVGRPIDEIVLNKALFDREGVKVLGVIVNKVLPNKLEKIKALVRKGLERQGIALLGVIPYEPSLSWPTVAQVLDETNFELVCGREFLENSASRVIVGAMKPNDAMKYITPGSLLITPGDREDIINIALKQKISGVVLTGDVVPEEEIITGLKKAQVPVLLSKIDTYNTASCVHDVTAKIRPQDTAKIEAAVNLIKNNVDFERILRGM